MDIIIWLLARARSLIRLKEESPGALSRKRQIKNEPEIYLDVSQVITYPVGRDG